MSAAIIIGSGVAGLAAAIRLATKGYTVDVYEAGPTPGGKLAEFSEGGYRFDMGPSLLTMPHLVEDLFREAGVDLRGRFSYQKLEEANRYFWEDGTRVTGWCDRSCWRKNWRTNSAYHAIAHRPTCSAPTNCLTARAAPSWRTACTSWTR